jgi:hypothetical protein
MSYALFFYDISLPTMERLDPKTAVRQWTGHKIPLFYLQTSLKCLTHVKREEHYYYGIYEAV